VVKNFSQLQKAEISSLNYVLNKRYSYRLEQSRLWNIRCKQVLVKVLERVLYSRSTW